MKKQSIDLRKAIKSGSIDNIKQVIDNIYTGIIDIQLVSALPPLSERKKGVIYIEVIDTGVPVASREQDVLLN